jgi:hypothetical protein
VIDLQLEEPRRGAETVQHFLGVSLGTDATASSADPSLYRRRVPPPADQRRLASH